MKQKLGRKIFQVQSKLAESIGDQSKQLLCNHRNVSFNYSISTPDYCVKTLRSKLVT